MYRVLIFAVFLLFPRLLCAQQGLKAYDRGALSEVRSFLLEGLQDSAEAVFLRAAMTTDADSALEIYRQVVLRYPESPVSQRALERIRQYYYAQGLYGRAAEIGAGLRQSERKKRILRKVETTPPPPFTTSPQVSTAHSKSKSAKYSLQVGAFSHRENALSLQKSLEKAGYSVRIVNSTQSACGLTVVRITGYHSEAEARAAAEKLQRKLKLRAIIVPEKLQE